MYCVPLAGTGGHQFGASRVSGFHSKVARRIATLWSNGTSAEQLWLVSGRYALIRRVGATEDTVLMSGTVPLDDTGQPVHAHEGWILQIEDSYLWYGTNHKINSSSASGSWDWISTAVNLYTSHDLSTWHKKSPVFTAAALPTSLQQQLGAAGPYRIERPKVLYNSARRYYVLIFHLDTLDSNLNQVGWAISPSPYGPFNFEQASSPDGLGSLDISVTAVVDPESQSNSEAYLVRSIPDGSISISRLASDYLSTTGVCTSIGPPPTAVLAAANAPATAVNAPATAVATASSRQAAVSRHGRATATAAPCLFSYKDHWYLLATDRRGWLPSQPELYVTEGPELCGANWTKLQRPATGPGADITFDSTPAFVMSYTFPGTSEVLLVYFGDRWNAQGPGSVGNASYVWLPLVPAAAEGKGASQLQLQLINPPDGKWRIGDYRPKAVIVT